MNELTGDEYRDAMRIKIYEVTGPNLDSHGCFKNTTDNRMKMKGDCFECPNNLQTVHTSFSICSEIVGKLREHTELVNKEICIFNLEFIDALKYDSNVPLDKVWFVTDCQNKVKVARYFGINVIEESLEIFLMNKGARKFDVVCMNPPYQGIQKLDDSNDKKKRRTGLTLWDKFVTYGINTLNENGFLAAIHPAKWRKPNDKLWEIMSKKQICYLEIHDEKDGQKTFNASTRYDWYILKNSNINNDTVIVDQNKNKMSVNITKIPFIPNGMHKEIFNLLAKNSEDRLTIINDYSYSFYETRKDQSPVRREKDGLYNFPCIYLINKKNEPTFVYSNTNNKGHFGIPKVIFSAGATGFIIDIDGSYGLTQFAKGIVAPKEDLSKIFTAIQSKKFQDIILACSLSRCEIDRDILRLFRKDFWKEFVNEDGTEKV